MKSMILTVALAIASSGAVFAQGEKTTCNMPDMGAVQQLGLEQEQLVQVRQIQAECMRECTAAKESKGASEAEVMAKHQSRIQEVLTPEQYERYQALNTERTEKKTAEPKQKAH